MKSYDFDDIMKNALRSIKSLHRDIATETSVFTIYFTA